MKLEALSYALTETPQAQERRRLHLEPCHLLSAWLPLALSYLYLAADVKRLLCVPIITTGQTELVAASLELALV